MDNDKYGIRASGDYVTYEGRDYFASLLRDEVRIFSDDEPLPPGFAPSRYNWIEGECFVPLSDIEHLRRVRTTCSWRGHRFEVRIIVGDMANLVYLGRDFDEVSGLPGMRRPDKFEVRGKAPVAELTDVEEHAEDVLFDGRTSGTRDGQTR
ncbi:hypothetical protein [Mycolicibacterium baixiangningiae]|uniref:hypothetical protein n=1 Tax=Mycolicibacterium baixiangningiae TaxID=2761578 RepID=UPI001865C606|nr:hypothetical protein [Mycolicibacterium baixiangningiae]